MVNLSSPPSSACFGINGSKEKKNPVVDFSSLMRITRARQNIRKTIGKQKPVPSALEMAVAGRKGRGVQKTLSSLGQR